MRNLTKLSGRVTGLGVIGALFGVFFLGVLAAEAGIAGSATPTWPVSATVGDLINTNVLIVNTSSNPNDTESVSLTTLFVTPACADGTSPICVSPNEDPGIFKVVSATGDASSAPCPGTVFTPGIPNPTTGEVSLTPGAAVILGPANGAVAARSCQVNLVLRVLQVPTNPDVLPGRTDPHTRAT